MLPKAPLRPAARNLIAAVAPNTRTATTSAYSTKSWPSSRLANSSNLQCSLRNNVFTLTFLHRFLSAQSPEYCCNSNRRAEPCLLDSSQYLKDLRQVLNPTHESHCKHMFTGGAVQRGAVYMPLRFGFRGYASPSRSPNFMRGKLSTHFWIFQEKVALCAASDSAGMGDTFEPFSAGSSAAAISATSR